MATGPSPAEPSITEVTVDASFSRSRLWTWAFEHLGGVFPPPLQRDASLGCMGMWTYFPRGDALSSRGGRFPMCRVRFFFAALDTCWPPQGTSAGICTPKSHPLMPSPTSSPSQPLETLEVMCSHTVTLGHQTTQGGAWEASRKSRVPRPHAPPRRPSKACFLPCGTSQKRPALPEVTGQTDLQAGWRGGRSPVQPSLVLPGDSGLGRTSQRGHMGLHADVCFPRQRVPLPPALPWTTPPAGLGPGTRFFLTPQVEQTSDWGRGWRTNPEGGPQNPLSPEMLSWRPWAWRGPHTEAMRV